MSEKLTLWQHLKRYFLGGVLIVVPFILTFLVLKFLFETVDGLLQPALQKLLGFYPIGLGLLTTLLIILLAGVLTRNLLGAHLLSMGDRLAGRVPFVRPIYSGSKQLLESLTRADASSFHEVALIEYPRQGLFSLCFVSKRSRISINGVEKEYCTCFVPSTPTPVTGMTVVVPAENVTSVDMTIEDGVKFFVSGGVVSPEIIKNRAPGTEAPLKEDHV